MGDTDMSGGVTRWHLEVVARIRSGASTSIIMGLQLVFFLLMRQWWWAAGSLTWRFVPFFVAKLWIEGYFGIWTSERLGTTLSSALSFVRGQDRRNLWILGSAFVTDIALESCLLYGCVSRGMAPASAFAILVSCLAISGWLFGILLTIFRRKKPLLLGALLVSIAAWAGLELGFFAERVWLLLVLKGTLGHVAVGAFISSCNSKTRGVGAPSSMIFPAYLVC